MKKEGKILLGKAGEEQVWLYPRMANRHGLIAGATGTGKTITLKVLAESFSDCGVPVFLADAKGDLAGMCECGVLEGKVQERVSEMGLEADGFACKAYPTVFWDVFEKSGLPLRTTISEMGPMLLARILGLNRVQSDILTVIFKIADDEGLLLIDTKDLRSMLQYVGENAKDFGAVYGNLPSQSLAAITRAVVALESAGGDQFFGEPALDIRDWLRTDCDGKGVIEILDCRELMQNPTMYATFLLWMLSELFEILPEAGDLEKPKLVFFFDEAHMLFDDASPALIQKVEQVVKLIRSKGVGIYFITQNPQDIPDGVLGQLGNRIQHALHAYTPADQKAVRAAAQAFRANPAFNTEEMLGQLGTGEALVSVLDEEGVPTTVQHCRILPPQSKMGAIDDGVRQTQIAGCLLYSKYKDDIDRDSAYEFLLRKSEDAVKAAQQAEEEARQRKEAEKEEKERLKAEEKAEREQQKAEEKAEKERQKAEERAEKERKKAEEAQIRKTKSTINKVAGSAVGTIGRQLGNEVGKKLGGSFGKKVGGNVGASLGRGLLSTLLKL